MKDQKFCEKRCVGRIVDAKRGIYCKCIEKKLPKPSKQSVKAYPTEKIDDFWLRQEISQDGVPEEQILYKLRKFGLDPYEVELLMLRYVEGFSMKKIVVEQGWLSIGSANHYLHKALAKLRAGKFSFR